MKDSIVSLRFTEEDLKLIDKMVNELNSRGRYLRVSRSSLISHLAVSVCHTASVRDIEAMAYREPIRQDGLFRLKLVDCNDEEPKTLAL